jgi:DNA-binding PadR family transcriptional regulator
LDNLTELLKGVLEGTVLELIGRGETYGYEITRRLNAMGFADVVEGTVYAILVRLERSKLVEVAKRPSLKGPERKFYSLNEAGRKELALFWEKWTFVSSRINVLQEESRNENFR